MSRSWKKPIVWLSSRITKYAKRAFRHQIKQNCHEAEINFDPDADFEELRRNRKLFEDWGTRCGFEVPPDDADETWYHESYNKLKRK